MNKKNVCVYIADFDTYSKLQNEIHELYYKKYGQSLSKSEVLVKSMLCLKENLSTAEKKSEQLPLNLTRIL